MNVKKYKLIYDFREIEIEVDHNKISEKDLHQINDFWSGSTERLNANENNVLYAVLKMLAIQIIQVQIEYNYNEFGVIGVFDKGIEGWPKMDGTNGFKIVSVDEFLPDDYDISIEEIEE